jgi:putative transposase
VTGVVDKILARYARGMTVREIQGFLTGMSAVEVSPDLISTVPDGVPAEVTAGQTRPLEPMYPVVCFDALRVEIRDEATVRSKAIDLALAVLPDGSFTRTDSRRPPCEIQPASHTKFRTLPATLRLCG